MVINHVSKSWDDPPSRVSGARRFGPESKLNPGGNHQYFGSSGWYPSVAAADSFPKMSCGGQICDLGVCFFRDFFWKV